MIWHGMKNLNYTLLHRDPLLIIASALFSLFLGITLAAFPANIPDAYATGTCAAGWRVGATQVINCHGVCRFVGRSGGLDFFVPTATAGEWTRFRENPATNATVAVCIMRVFVTSTSHSGNLGGLSGADNFCMARAAAAGLAGRWVALLSTNEVDARNRIHYNWGRLDNMIGLTVAHDEANLWKGSIRFAIDRDEFGAIRTGGVWSGSWWDGRRRLGITDCANWALIGPGELGRIGVAGQRTVDWFDQSFVHCGQPMGIYCVEQ